MLHPAGDQGSIRDSRGSLRLTARSGRVRAQEAVLMQVKHMPACLLSMLRWSLLRVHLQVLRHPSMRKLAAHLARNAYDVPLGQD